MIYTCGACRGSKASKHYKSFALFYILASGIWHLVSGIWYLATGNFYILKEWNIEKR